MVDLAKIRRKAKKKDEPKPEEPPAVETSAVATPVAEGGQSAMQREPQPVPAQDEPAMVPAAPVAKASKLDAFREQAGKRRELGTAKAEELASDHQTLELLTFIISGEHYAVDIERIVEIVTPRPVTRIPNAEDSIVGIISLRGTIVTLVDVRRKLRHPPAGEASADTRIVVIDFQNEVIGFVVDRVLRVVKATPGDIEPHPVVHSTELDESIRGVFRAGSALTILLDLDKLLHHRWI